MFKKLLVIILALGLAVGTALASTPPYTFDDNTSGEVAVERLLLNQNDLYSRLDSATASATEWLANSYTPAYVAGTQFTIAADVSSQFMANRRVRCTLTSGYVYGTIQSATYSSPNTTVTLTASVLDSTLSAVELGAMTSGANSSRPADIVTLTGSETLTNKTLTSPVLNTGVSGTAVIDDDTMATASDSTLATSESVKAYVDTSLSTRTKELNLSIMGSISTGTKLVQVIPGFSGTITGIKAVLDSGTSATITIKNGSNTVYSGLVVDSTGVTQTSGLSNTSVTAFSKLQIDVTAIDTSPVNLLVYIEITKS